MRFQALFFFLLTSLGLGANAFAKDPIFPEIPGFQGGMESELSAEHIAKLMGLFDFRRLHQDLKQNSFSSNPVIMIEEEPKLFDNYLRDNPNAFASLPKKMQNELTQGLHLEKLVDTKNPKFELGKSPALQIDPSPTIERKTLILPGTTAPQLMPTPTKPALVPAEPLAPTFQSKGGLILPKRMDWEELYARWQKLPPEKKAEVVDWELLSPDVKARLVMEYEHSSKWRDGPMLKLKDLASIPEMEEKQRLLTQMKWGTELKRLEFTHREPVKTPADLYRDIVDFGKLAGVSSALENPVESKLKGANLHYHLSIEGRNLEPFADLFNDMTFLKRVQQGTFNDLTAAGEYLYNPKNIKSKGLVRLVEKNRIEIRAHPEKLVDEFKNIVEILAKPEAEGLAVAQAQLKRLLADPEIIARIMKLNPKLLLKWKEYLPAKVLRNIEINQSEASILKRLKSKDGQEIRGALASIDSNDLLPPKIMDATLDIFLSEADPFVTDSAFRVLQRDIQTVKSDRFWQALPKAFPKLSDPVGAALWAIHKTRYWPAGFGHTFFTELATNPNITFRTKLIYDFIQQDPPAALIEEILSPPNPVEKEYIDDMGRHLLYRLRTIEEDYSPSRVLQLDYFLEILNDQQASGLFEFLVARRYLPDEFWPVFLKILARKDVGPKLSKEIAKVLKTNKIPSAVMEEILNPKNGVLPEYRKIIAGRMKELVKTPVKAELPADGCAKNWGKIR